MRISKELASKVAKAMMSEKRKKQDDLFAQFKDKLKQAYIITIPQLVLDTFKKHPDYFHTTRVICIDTNGFNNFHVNIDTPILNNSGNYYTFYHPSPSASSSLMKLKNSISSLRDKNDKLELELKETIIALRTFARIQELLPEAVPFLPKSQSTEIIVDLTQLRKKINS